MAELQNSEMPVSMAGSREVDGVSRSLQGSAAFVGYGRVAQTFHWLSATLIVVLVAIGLYCDWIGDGPTRSWLLESWHKPLGLSVIAITLLRLCWKYLQPKVADVEGLAALETVLSHLTHVALYAILLAMPLSGLLMSQGAGRPTSFFGLFDVPQMLWTDPLLKPREQYWYGVGKMLHEQWFNWSLYILVALHVAGALKHWVIDANSDYFRRIWNWRG